MTKTVQADYTCECGEKLSFVWDIDDRPDEQEALCPECEEVIFRPPIRPSVNSGWKQFKDEEPKENQKVWLYRHLRRIYPNLKFYTFQGQKLWGNSPIYLEVVPEDYWMPFAYPEPPKVS